MKQFTVTIMKAYRGKELATIDGNKFPDRLLSGGSGGFHVPQSYVGVLRRQDSRFSLYLEWVDADGQGHRVEFPHELVERIVTVRDRIIDEAISNRAVRAMETRMQNGYVPTFAKRKQEEEEDE